MRAFLHYIVNNLLGLGAFWLVYTNTTPLLGDLGAVFPAAAIAALVFGVLCSVSSDSQAKRICRREAERLRREEAEHWFDAC